MVWNDEPLELLAVTECDGAKAGSFQQLGDIGQMTF